MPNSSEGKVSPSCKVEVGDPDIERPSHMPGAKAAVDADEVTVYTCKYNVSYLDLTPINNT